MSFFEELTRRVYDVSGEMVSIGDQGWFVKLRWKQRGWEGEFSRLLHQDTAGAVLAWAIQQEAERSV